MRAICSSKNLNTAVPITGGATLRRPMALAPASLPARLARRASGIQVEAPVMAWTASAQSPAERMSGAEVKSRSSTAMLPEAPRLEAGLGGDLRVGTHAGGHQHQVGL